MTFAFKKVNNMNNLWEANIKSSDFCLKCFLCQSLWAKQFRFDCCSLCFFFLLDFHMHFRHQQKSMQFGCILFQMRFDRLAEKHSRGVADNDHQIHWEETLHIFNGNKFSLIPFIAAYQSTFPFHLCASIVRERCWQFQTKLHLDMNLNWKE